MSSWPPYRRPSLISNAEAVAEAAAACFFSHRVTSFSLSMVLDVSLSLSPSLSLFLEGTWIDDQASAPPGKSFDRFMRHNDIAKNVHLDISQYH
jgi:hypothetical protein